MKGQAPGFMAGMDGYYSQRRDTELSAAPVVVNNASGVRVDFSFTGPLNRPTLVVQGTTDVIVNIGDYRKFYLFSR